MLRAKDADRIVSEQEQRDQEANLARQRQQDKRREELRKDVPARAREYLIQLETKIAKAAKDKERKCDWWACIEDEENGYKVEIGVKSNYGAEYEGLMDPCLVATPYCNTSIDVKVAW